MANCNKCGFPIKANKQFCTRCGAKVEATVVAPRSMQQAGASAQVQCSKCGAMLPAGKRFCTSCGASKGATIGAPVNRAVAISAAQHSPIRALLFGVFIPGAGQAYNGQPVKGFFLLFASALVLPYLYSLYDAYTAAARIAAAGGRAGRGGLIWVLLQVWLAFNTALFVAIVLTIMGVLV